jgi:hypothetical protein
MAVLLLGLLGGCASRSAAPDAPKPEAGVPAVSFSADVVPLVQARCATVGCHDQAITKNHWTNFSTADTTYARWVNAPGFDFCIDTADAYLVKTIVVPGYPAESFLIDKLSSTRETPCKENHYPRMPPPPLPRLDPAQIDMIARWIREGAQDN